MTTTTRGYGLGRILSILLIAIFSVPLVSTAEIVTVEEGEKKLTIKIGGELFTEYHFSGVDRPYCYPVIGPTGTNITRNYPMSEGPGESKDHPHHTGLWFTHGDVNGHDFWHKTKIVHSKFRHIRTGKKKGGFTAINHWKDKDGKIVCIETRSVTIHGATNPKLLDITSTIRAPKKSDVVFGDTKEGSMAIRLAPTMRLKGEVAKGHIVNSEGDRDGDTWGKRAKWVDYYGPVQDKTVGVAIFDHPTNPRHPTWWHVRDYGLFAANPFGVSYFEKQPRGAGDLKVTAGESIQFKYRFVFHTGNEKDADVEGLYSEFAN